MLFKVATTNTELACHPSKQGGFSLMEVLVAGAITSSGLAGLAALLISSVAGTAQTSYRTTASMLVESIRATVAISPQARDAFLLAPPSVVPTCDEYSPCTSFQFAAANFKSWQLQVSLALPGGLGVVCRDDSPIDGTAENSQCSNSGPLVVKVFWHAGAPRETSVGRLVQVIG